MFLNLEVGTLTELISGRQWEPAEIRRQVTRRANRLMQHDFRPGDRILIHFGNRLEFFAELLAIWRLGGCAIPVDTRLTGFEIENLIVASSARFSIVDDDTDLESFANDVIVHATETGIENDDCQIPELSVIPDNDALILFTSGSTGQPKGVVHTYRSLFAKWTALNDCLGVSDFRRTLCLLPTHFGHGLICNSLFPWLSGCDLVVAPPFQSEVQLRLGEIIDSHEITFMSSVPSVWNLALKVSKQPEKGSLQRIHVGSAPLSASQWTDIQAWATVDAVVNAYGITETGSWVAGTNVEDLRPESGLIGLPWGAKIRVSRQHDTSTPPDPSLECAPGEEGMIWLDTPSLMRGYFEQREQTDAVMRDGWFMTGDIGVIDGGGRLFLRGRERDEINKGGQKVYPADIDDVAQRFPAVVDACTFRVEDSYYGENVGIAIVLDEQTDEELVALYDWFDRHLAEHKQPVQWFCLAEIPRTSRGKINRESVMKACLDETPVDLRKLLKNRRTR